MKSAFYSKSRRKSEQKKNPSGNLAPQVPLKTTAVLLSGGRKGVTPLAKVQHSSAHFVAPNLCELPSLVATTSTTS